MEVWWILEDLVMLMMVALNSEKFSCQKSVVYKISCAEDQISRVQISRSTCQFERLAKIHLFHSWLHCYTVLRTT